MHYKIIFLFLSIVMSLSSMAQIISDSSTNFHTPKRETRAVWLTTYANLDWPKTYAKSVETIEKQKQELISILNLYQATNINTVLLQTRVRATTIYPSAIEPWDKCITGTEGKAPGYDYDPLKFAIEECHKRGIAIHAWVVSMPVGNKKSLAVRRLRQKGLNLRLLGTNAYLNPSDKKTPEYLSQLCAEIVRNYDIDGIHLDYIRYPDGWPNPSRNNGDTPDNRRAKITNIVRTIHKQVKNIKPWVRLSCSPIGKYTDLNHYSSKNYNAYNRVFQEAQEWLRLGFMDQLYPMQYFRASNYYPFLANWEENKHNKDIISGIGTYFLSPKEGKWKLNEIKRQMNVSRTLGIGHAHFRSAFLTNNTQGILNFENSFNSFPALPPIPNNETYRVKPPLYINNHNKLVFNNDNNTKLLVWDGSSPYYNIYASKSFPVDINKAENLLYAKFTGKSLILKSPYHQDNIHFAITAIDRYDKESIALQESISITQPILYSRLLINNGSVLELPQNYSLFKVRCYIIETPQGNIIRKIFPISATNNLPITGLSKGIYKLKAIFPNSKQEVGLGFFFVNN